jgi:hypothetical protein
MTSARHEAQTTSPKKVFGLELEIHESSLPPPFILSLMPPPRSLLSPRIPGFICRSCLLRRDLPRQQRPPWLVRNATTGNGPPRPVPKWGHSPPPSVVEQEPNIRYFDQTPDGDRREVDDSAEEAFLKSIGTEMEEIDARTNAMLGIDDPGGIADEDKDAAIQGKIDEEEDTRDITIATNDLENLIVQIKALSEKDVITKEDRSKIREVLFNFKPNEDIKRRLAEIDPDDGKYFNSHPILTQ